MNTMTNLDSFVVRNTGKGCQTKRTTRLLEIGVNLFIYFLVKNIASFCVSIRGLSGRQRTFLNEKSVVLYC